MELQNEFKGDRPPGIDAAVERLITALWRMHVDHPGDPHAPAPTISMRVREEMFAFDDALETALTQVLLTRLTTRWESIRPTLDRARLVEEAARDAQDAEVLRIANHELDRPWSPDWLRHEGDA